MYDPVCRLNKALYEHPNSGSYWEEKCDRKVRMEGFLPIGESGEWRSCYLHPGLGVMFVVYVDDFKMAGLREDCEICWKNLRGGQDAIEMDDPSEVGAYLGCSHLLKEEKCKDGTNVRVMEYNMEPFLEQCIASYISLTGSSANLTKVTTPFIDEDDNDNVARQPVENKGRASNVPGVWGSFPESAFVKQHVCAKSVAPGAALSKDESVATGAAPINNTSKGERVQRKECYRKWLLKL